MAKRLTEDKVVADPVRSRIASVVAMAASPPPAAAQAPAQPTQTQQPAQQSPPETVDTPNPEEREPVEVVSRAQPTQTAPVPHKQEPPPRYRSEDRNRAIHRSHPDARAIEVRKAKFTRDEAEDNDAIVDLLARLTGSKVTQSHVTRALWSLLRRSEEELRSSRGRAPALKRPPNGFGVDQAEYEEDVARFLLQVLKSLRL